ncbi:hypothetical protein ACFY2K_42565 [Kitasatospora sp. NPDC001309]|uniref:hypothetical protein n=1 Tax=Kitasatospora sp. NPDC001309 TaxID=3364013 RepID=UPI0036CCC20A
MALERRKVLFGEPVEATGDAERDALATAVKAIEAREGERRGWDQPPRLFSLHLADIDSGAIELRIIPPRQWASGHRNPADDLAAWAMRYPAPGPVTPLAFADSPDGFAGIAMMYEGWAAPDDAKLSPEEEARRALGERTFTQRSDRVEVRMVTAVDINGHSYLLRRLRGREVELAVTAADPDSSVRNIGEARGKLPHAIGRIAHAVRTGALVLG